jgi:DNA-binding NarL/FixJ family response regulator
MSTITMPASPRHPDQAAVRVLICDDHPLVLRLLRTAMGAREGLEVVAQAPDGALAVALATELAPEVVVVDLGMPGLDGLQAVAAIRAALPACVILVFSADDVERAAGPALAAGADRYLSKDAGFEAVADAALALAGR